MSQEYVIEFFTEEEKKDLHLPMDSRWKEYKED